MNILHYSIGCYPDRQGGLVRYSTDLALKQSKTNNVFYLFPGKLGFVDKKVKIIKDNRIHSSNLYCFRIDNAHPIPLYSGITNVGLYTREVDEQIYIDFLRIHRIKVLHVHSLMGLHIELLQAAHKLRIPILMTTHDFFGLCPVTTLFKDGKICCNNSINSQCFSCSQRALSYSKLALGQSALYKKIKHINVVGKIRKNALVSKTKISTTSKRIENKIPNYEKLEKYYRKCFSLIDYYLFNSSQTKEVFESRLGHLPGEILYISLSSIVDRRKKRSFLKDDTLHIGFMGDCTDFKGYYVLRQAVERLINDGYRVELDVYNDNSEQNSFIVRKGKYTSNQLKRIYDFLDVIVVPSLWYETLSFIAIEAISAGMPCIVSDHVGAKTFIKNEQNGFIVSAGRVGALIDCLQRILNCPEKLYSVNSIILNEPMLFDFIIHCNKITAIYKGVLNDR